MSAFDKKSSQSQFSHYFTFGELLEILRLLRHDHRQVLSTLAFIFFLQQITLALKEKFWQKHIFSLNCRWLSESAGRRTGFYCWDCDSHASYFYWPAHGWYVNFYSIKHFRFFGSDVTRRLFNHNKELLILWVSMLCKNGKREIIFRYSSCLSAYLVSKK